jgi:D-hexose-6-phosphate mutarotase
LANGATLLELSLGKSDLSEAHWHGNVRLTLKVTIGDTLEIVLTTLNESENEVTFTDGLHTYFQISDIANIRVLGLRAATTSTWSTTIEFVLSKTRLRLTGNSVGFS